MCRSQSCRVCSRSHHSRCTIDTTREWVTTTLGKSTEDCSPIAQANKSLQSVCVRPSHAAQAVANCGSSVSVDIVVGFPEGTQDLSQKLHETKQALSAGAHELDIVLNRTHLSHHDYNAIYNELALLRSLAPHPTLLKLILETSQLDDSQIIAASTIAAVANFDFIKTSTGFLGHGATEHHVRLMAACCNVLVLPGPIGAAAEPLTHPAADDKMIQEVGRRKMRVKASGGIRTVDDAVKMLEAGASRLGTSGGVWIVKEGREVVERCERKASIVRYASTAVDAVHNNDGGMIELGTGTTGTAGQGGRSSRKGNLVQNGGAAVMSSRLGGNLGAIVIGNGIAAVDVSGSGSGGGSTRASIDRPGLATRLFTDF